MSKYFNEAVKKRTAAIPLESLKIAAVRDIEEIPAAVPPGIPQDFEGERLEQCEKVEIPLSKIFRAKFQGSKSLEAAEESYRALRTRLLRARSTQTLRSIVITSPSQGEGKTLTSLNLALCCAQLRDMRILLIDGDIRSQGLSRLVRTSNEVGLAQVLAEQCEPENAVMATDLPNLFVLPSGTLSSPAPELFANKRWQELVSWCHETFKLVLVDSPPSLNLSDVELISAACDGVLMVVRARQTRRDSLRKSVAQIDAKKLLGVVFNAASQGTHYRYQYAEGERKSGYFSRVLRDPESNSQQKGDVKENVSESKVADFSAGKPSE
jgi:capsular exopolysaccharide synthesis family protein